MIDLLCLLCVSELFLIDLIANTKSSRWTRYNHTYISSPIYFFLIVSLGKLNQSQWTIWELVCSQTGLVSIDCYEWRSIDRLSPVWYKIEKVLNYKSCSGKSEKRQAQRERTQVIMRESTKKMKSCQKIDKLTNKSKS